MSAINIIEDARFIEITDSVPEMTMTEPEWQMISGKQNLTTPNSRIFRDYLLSSEAFQL